MARKPHSMTSGLLILLFLVALSFVIANWSGASLSTVIIVVVSLATLAMIGMVVWKQAQKGISEYGRATKRKPSLSSKQKKWIALGFVGLGILILLVFIAPSIINWFRQNLRTIITVVLLLAGLAVVGIIIWRYRGRWLHKGYINNYEPQWTWSPKKIKSTLALDVWKSLLKFSPSKSYDSETPYHDELYEWLRLEFPNANVQRTPKIGASIVDLAINDIGIEIKGPTGNDALNTLTTKTLKYRRYYNNIFFVLFEPRFTPRNFNEIKVGIQNSWPDVGVITKKG